MGTFKGAPHPLERDLRDFQERYGRRDSQRESFHVKRQLPIPSRGQSTKTVFLRSAISQKTFHFTREGVPRLKRPKVEGNEEKLVVRLYATGHVFQEKPTPIQ